jgi:hypothetical protein
MNVLKIKGSDSDSEVVLDGERGIFEFSGRFLPQRTREYFEPILSWIDNYSKKPYSKSTIIFKLDYFNTSSSKKFLDILLIFQSIYSHGFDVEIEWYFHKDDIDLKDAGLGYAELVDLPFKYKEY